MDDPQALFSLLTETLGLPVAWPLKPYPSFQSGVVALGNLYLEIIQCAPRRAADGRGPRLRERDMLGAVTDNEIIIAPAKLEGLDVRLVA